MWLCQHPRRRTTAAVPTPAATMLRGQAQRQNLPRDKSKPPKARSLSTPDRLDAHAHDGNLGDYWKMPRNSISGFRDKEDLAHSFTSLHTPMCFGRLSQRQPEADVKAQLAAGDPRQYLLHADEGHFRHPGGSEQPERAYL